MRLKINETKWPNEIGYFIGEKEVSLTWIENSKIYNKILHTVVFVNKIFILCRRF